MKTTKLITALTLSTLAGVALAQTPVITGTVKATQVQAPIVIPLTIASVTPVQAANPDLMVITGTGLQLVERVFVGDKEGLIVSKTPTTLTFQPMAGDPGMWPVVVFTKTERAESMAMYMPCVTIKPQDAIWYEGQRYLVVDGVFGVHVDSGVPGPFHLFASFEPPRTTGIVVDGFDYSFWLSQPWYVFGVGMVPDSGSTVVQYRLPREMMGQTLYVQGLVLQHMGPAEFHVSFTNMDHKHAY